MKVKIFAKKKKEEVKTNKKNYLKFFHRPAENIKS
jgi:hypothetical protein